MYYLPHTPFWMRMIFPKGVTWKGKPDGNKVYLTFDDGPTPLVTQFVIDQLRMYDYKATFFCIGENVKKHASIFRQLKDDGHAVGNHTMHHPNGWKMAARAYADDVLEADKWIGSHLFRPPYGKITAAEAALIRKELGIRNWELGEAASNEEFGIGDWELGGKANGAKELGIGNLELGEAANAEELGIGDWELGGKANGAKELGIRNWELGNTGNRLDPNLSAEIKIVMWSVITGDFDNNIDGETCFNRVKQYTKPGSIIVFHDSDKAFPRLKDALPKTLEWIKEQGLVPAVID